METGITQTNQPRLYASRTALTDYPPDFLSYIVILEKQKSGGRKERRMR